MKNETRKRHIMDNGTPIERVGEFINEIAKLYLEDENNDDTVYYRGHKTYVWDLYPSVFRKNNISREDEYLKHPTTLIPSEFHTLKDDFEIMTKCQHYGLCTRLLDVTTNPLVALYFACEPINNANADGDESDNGDENIGVVFYGKGFPVSPRERDVSVVTALAKMDLKQGMPLSDVLDELKQQAIITNEEKQNWLDGNIKGFISIVQKSHLVFPVYSNDRLRNQRGLFLLASNYIVEPVEDGFYIQKGVSDLKDDFHESCFYIEEKNKESILRELNYCNINEASLFPELEHQLNYIRNNVHGDTSSTLFFPFEDEDRDEEEKRTISDTINKNEEFAKLIRDAIGEMGYDAEIEDSIYKTIIDIVEKVDWFKRKSIISGMKNRIYKLLMSNEDEKTHNIKEDSNKIVQRVVEIAEECSKE